MGSRFSQGENVKTALVAVVGKHRDDFVDQFHFSARQ
jgi:hypothetical protein